MFNEESERERQRLRERERERERGRERVERGERRESELVWQGSWVSLHFFIAILSTYSFSSKSVTI